MHTHDIISILIKYIIMEANHTIQVRTSPDQPAQLLRKENTIARHLLPDTNHRQRLQMGNTQEVLTVRHTQQGSAKAIQLTTQPASQIILQIVS